MGQRDDLITRSRQLAGIEEGLQDWTLRKKSSEVGQADIDVADAAIAKVVVQLEAVAGHVKALQTSLEALGEAAQEAEQATPTGGDVSPLSRRVVELQTEMATASHTASSLEESAKYMKRLGTEAAKMVARVRLGLGEHVPADDGTPHDPSKLIGKKDTDGEMDAAAQARHARGVARVRQVAWDAHNKERLHGAEYAKARAHTKLAATHAAAGDRKKAYQHAAAAHDAHKKAEKAAVAMGDHELAGKHRGLGQHVLAHHADNIKKPKAGKK